MGYLVKLNDFLFEDSAKRGDRISLAVRMKRKLGMLVLFYGEAWVGEKKICSGEMTFFREAQG
jgi:3-hydroxymyristoyl/3-hydroxydecanoyl-(acyl carrier protein) dehydratase